MENIIIPSIILFLVVGLNYVCITIASSYPKYISGFKSRNNSNPRNTKSQRVKSLVGNLRIANLLTLFGGVIGIVFRLQIIYYLSLTLPIAIAVLCTCCRWGRNEIKKKERAIILFFGLTFITFMLLPVIYIYHCDLNVAFTNEKIDVGGIYGVEIPLCEIDTVKLCHALPAISIRTNGFALNGIYIGHFRTKNKKNIMLFTHSDTCFLCIIEKTGMTYYLSFRTKEKTRQLFLKIRDLIKHKKQNN